MKSICKHLCSIKLIVYKKHGFHKLRDFFLPRQKNNNAKIVDTLVKYINFSLVNGEIIITMYFYYIPTLLLPLSSLCS